MDWEAVMETWDEVEEEMEEVTVTDPLCGGRYRRPLPLDGRAVRQKAKREKHRSYKRKGEEPEEDMWPLDSKTQGAMAWFRRVFGVSKRCYEMFRLIARQKWFLPEKIPAYRSLGVLEEDRFAPLPLWTMAVPSNKKPSTNAEGKLIEEPDVEVPFHSLFDVLRRLLQYPGNLETMKVGAIHQPKFSKEMWHGAIMRESPLYTFPAFCGSDQQEFLLNDDVYYTHDDELYMGRIVAICAIDDNDARYKELCQKMTLFEALNALRGEKTLMCRIRPYCEGEYAEEVQLDFDTEHMVLDLNSVMSKAVIVWPEGGRQSRNTRHTGSTGTSETGIRSYRCTHGRVTTRQACAVTPLPRVLPIDECPLLPVRAWALDPSSLRDHPTLPTLRLFLVYYYDDFGTYSKVYHQSGGCYLTLGNLPHWQQVKLHNIFPLFIKPPDASKEDVHEIFKQQVKELERGVVINLGPIIGDVYVVGGLGLCKTDMPEGQRLCGLKSQGADIHCRKCYKLKGLLNDFDQDAEDRTLHGDNEIRSREGVGGITGGQHERMMYESGLHYRGPRFEGLACHPYNQTPQDPFHTEYMRIAKYATTNLNACLNENDVKELNEIIDTLQIPMHWGRNIPQWRANSGKSSEPGSLKWTGGQLGKFIQMSGLILKDFLHADRFKRSAVQKLSEQVGPNFIDDIIKSFVLLGRLNKEVFHPDYGYINSELDQEVKLNKLVLESRTAFVNVWGHTSKHSFGKTPTVHAAVHYSDTLIDCGGIHLVNVERDETKHGPLRRIINNSNHRALELDMMKWNNAQSSIGFLGAGGGKHLYMDRQPEKEFFEFLQTEVIVKLLKGSKTGRTKYETEDSDDELADRAGDVGTGGITEQAESCISGPLTGQEEPIVPRYESKNSRDMSVSSELRALVENFSVQNACDINVTDLRVESCQHITMIDREAWRGKLHKGQFFSFKRQMNDWPAGAIAYCHDVLVFHWVNDEDLESDVALVLVRLAVPTTQQCDRTGFPYFELDSTPSALVRTIDLASPVHLVHMCDGDRCKALQAQGDTQKHDLASNPLFMFNPTCF
jgi:hypothetical protein